MGALPSRRALATLVTSLLLASAGCGESKDRLAVRDAMIAHWKARARGDAEALCQGFTTHAKETFAEPQAKVTPEEGCRRYYRQFKPITGAADVDVDDIDVRNDLASADLIINGCSAYSRVYLLRISDRWLIDRFAAGTESDRCGASTREPE